MELAFAEDGAQVLATWRRQRFDLVLMDANTPVMHGTEAGQPRVPIWMLTANVSAEDIDRYPAAGADGVLRKPVDAAALFGLIAEVGSAAGVREA